MQLIVVCMPASDPVLYPPLVAVAYQSISHQSCVFKTNDANYVTKSLVSFISLSLASEK